MKTTTKGIRTDDGRECRWDDLVAAATQADAELAAEYRQILTTAANCRDAGHYSALAAIRRVEAIDSARSARAAQAEAMRAANTGEADNAAARAEIQAIRRRVNREGVTPEVEAAADRRIKQIAGEIR